jgi:branched-chain amino acid transport system ATP-binding protein
VLLQLRGVSKSFGGLRVLDGVDLAVEAGAVHALIGPNGSGKTTLLNCVSGILAADDGQILLRERRIDGLRPHRRTALGLGRTFQNIRLFAGMSVLDNVLVGRHCRTRAGLLRAWTRAPFRSLAEDRESRERARELLALVGLAARGPEPAEGLPLADQRRLEIARALATEPKLLLLDEPTAGLSPAESHLMTALLKRLDPAMTILIIEHDMDVAFELTDRITVLHFGKVVADGVGQAVKADPLVQEIYLGTG